MTVPALSEWRTACSVERRGAFLTTGNARKKGEKRAMRKNKMMRAASGLLVAVLLSTCAISGTFAKYTTSADGTDSARVAKWGFQPTTIDLTNLFDDAYASDTGKAAEYDAVGNTVKAKSESTDVIAPGTNGSATFGFTYGGDNSATAPEVAYKFNVSTTGSSCDQSIQDNANIQWKLDTGDWGTWDQLLTAIEALDGNNPGDKYEPNTLPDAFSTAGPNTHTISWQWIFNTDDAADGTDTAMGNAAKLAEVELKITVTATQID